MSAIDCQEADVLAAAMSVGSLEDAEQATLQRHLSGCADCRRTAAEYMGAAARLPLVLEPRQPSPELRSRLMRAVYAEAAQTTSRRRAPAAGGLWRRLWVSIPAGRGFTLVGATAAILVVGLATYLGINRAPGTAPSSVAIALTAQQAAPDARGTLVYNREAHTAVLSVTGLPGPTLSGRVGSVYEVWLIPANGAAVAAAYLVQGPDGRWTAAVQGDLSRYATLATTVEPPGGSRSPTGPPVIQGSIIGV